MKQNLLNIDANSNVYLKDGDGNNIQITDAGSLVVPGVMKEVINWTPNATVTTSSATLVDISGISNTQINVPADGDYVFDLSVSGAFQNVTARRDWQFSIRLDDSTDHVFPLWGLSTDGTNGRHSFSHKIKINLTKGSHNIRLQFANNSASDSITVDTASEITLAIT